MLLTLLRLSLRVAEVCSLRARSIKWSHGRGIIKFKVKAGPNARFLLGRGISGERHSQEQGIGVVR